MYTNGKQFINSKTGQQYKGHYNIGPNGDYFTLQTYNFKDSIILNPIRNINKDSQADYDVELYKSLQK